MSGASLTVHQEQLQELLGGMIRRLGTLRPAMAIIGETARTSVIRNFEVGGRPEPWKPLAAATVRRRGAAGPILRRSGRLMNSISWTVGEDRVSIGTNVVYAAPHQFGARIMRRARSQTLAFGARGRFLSRKEASRRKTAVRVAFAQVGPHQITIPARPFLMIQDEDWPEMTRQISAFVVGRNE